jgi:hypothetical protein
MPPDENEGPQPRFPDPGRDETRYRPLPPPAGYGGEPPSYDRARRPRGCLTATVLIVLLIFLILLALDLLGVIDILSR